MTNPAPPNPITRSWRSVLPVCPNLPISARIPGDDAVSLLQQVTPLFDQEITPATDAGDLASYQALQALRADVV